MNYQQTINQLLKGERINMSYPDHKELCNYIDNEVDEQTYYALKKLVSVDVTMGSIGVLETFIKN